MGRGLKIRGIHRRILGYFARGDPIPFIIHNTGLNPGNFYKKIHTLEKYGYLRVKRVGKVLDVQLQPLAIKELGIVSVGAKRVEYINLHDVWIACEILKKPKEWGKKDFVEKILEMMSIGCTPNKVNNWKGIYFNYASVTVRITPNKVMFNPPHVEVGMDDSPENAKNLMLNHIRGIIPKIEKWFSVTLSRPNRVSMTVSSQHIAFVKSLIAKYFVDNEIDLVIYDDQGRRRVIVDKSRGPELEFPNKAYAEEDAGRMKTLIDDTVFGRFDHRQVNRDLSDASNIISQLAKEQLTYRNDLLGYGQKIAAHAKSIEVLGNGIYELTGLIKKLDVGISRKPKPIKTHPKRAGKMRSYWKRLSKSDEKRKNQRSLGEFS